MAALNNTTLSAALSREEKNVPLTSVSNISVGDLLIIGGEATKVTEIIGTTHVVVLRGYAGTHARPHASGALVYSGSEDKFGNKVPTGYAVSTDAPYLPHIVLAGGSARAFRILNDSWVEVKVGRRLNFEVEDPDTGYVYLLCESTAAITAGAWCVVDADGQAGLIATDSKGRVVVAVEAASASDTLFWGLVIGTYSAAQFDSDVTSACVLIAGAGIADISASAGGNVIHNATCITAVTSVLGTAYLNRAWVYGITNDIIP